jgi:hypothetical protein
MFAIFLRGLNAKDQKVKLTVNCNVSQSKVKSRYPMTTNIYLFIYYHTIAVLGVNDDIYKPSDLFLNISYRKFADMQNTYKDTSFSHSPHHVTISVY